MSQPHEVMAFRKRLKSAGYADIRIIRDDLWVNRNRDLYCVSAVEPLSGQRVSIELTGLQMREAFQRRRGKLTVAFESGAGIPTSASPKSGAGLLSNASPVLKMS